MVKDLKLIHHYACSKEETFIQIFFNSESFASEVLENVDDSFFVSGSSLWV